MEVAKLYTAFNKSLLTYIRSKINSREDAEDILQDVFMKISDKEGALAKKEDVKSWVFIVTKNAIIDHYRKYGNKRMTTLHELIPGNWEEEKDPMHGLEKCLSKFIMLLPDLYRNILLDSEIKGMRQKDLALKYDLPYSSLRSRVQRGREKLKQLLTACCKIEADRRGNILEVIPRQNNAKDSCKSCEN